MRTMTLLASAAMLAVGTMLAGFDLAHAQQLGTGSNALGSGGASIGKTEVQTVEDQRAVAPAALGGCVTNRTDFRTQTNQVSTDSQDFVPMPNTHFPVTTSGGCLIVDFSGHVSSLNGLYIRAVIAGIGPAEPSHVGRAVADLTYETRSVRFVFPNVPAGQHVIRIEYASASSTAVFAKERTLTVQYRP